MISKLSLAHIAAFVILALPIVASAADGYTLLVPIAPPEQSGNPNVSGFADYAQMMFKIIVGIAGLIAVTILIIGGIEYVSSGFSGNEGARSSAHKRIWDAITGLVLALTGYLILQTINPKLVEFNLDIKQIKGSSPAIPGELDPNLAAPVPTGPVPTPSRIAGIDNPLGEEYARYGLTQYKIAVAPGTDVARLTQRDINILNDVRQSVCRDGTCISIVGGSAIPGQYQLASSQALMNHLSPQFTVEQAGRATRTVGRPTTTADLVVGQEYTPRSVQGRFVYTGTGFLYTPQP